MFGGKAPFVIPQEMAQILASPSVLKGSEGQKLRTLYQDTAYNFSPFRDLTNFGTYCFIGDYEGVVREYNRVKPNLKGSETPYKWGYVMLASAGSRQWLNLSQPAPPFSPFIPTLLFLIGSGAPIDLADIAGLTALHHVAMNNRIGEVLQILLAAGANPNKQDRYGCTPLLSAIVANQAEAVEMCLKNGADMEICDNDGYSSLYTVRHADPAVHAIVHRHKRLMEGIAVPMEDKGKCAACGKTGSKSQCARCRVARYCSPHCQGEIIVHSFPPFLIYYAAAVTHWKAGHKTTCVPFHGIDATIVCKPTFGNDDIYEFKNIRPMMRAGMDDGETERRKYEKEMAEDAPKGQGSKPYRKTQRQMKWLQFRPSMLGKPMIVKVQVPASAPSGANSFHPTEPINAFEFSKSAGITLAQAEEIFGLYGRAISVEGQILVYNRSRDFVCIVKESDQPEIYAKVEAVVREKGSLGGLKGYFVAELETEKRLKIKIGEILADQPW